MHRMSYSCDAQLNINCFTSLCCFAGVPPPDHDEEETAQELATVAARACAQAPEDVTSAETSTALATSAESGVSEPASLPTAATTACMPPAALPLASVSEVAATTAVSSASLPQFMLPTALHGAGQGIRVQAGVTSAASQLAAYSSRSPARQFRGPGMSAQPSVSMPAAPGVDPAIAPFAGLLTSPAAAPPPPAVHGMMGGHGMIYVPGYGVMPVAPSVLPTWGPHVSAGMPVYGTQPAGMPVHSTQPAGMPVHSTQPAGMPVHSTQPAGMPVHSIQPAGMPVHSTQPAGMPVYGSQSSHMHGPCTAFGAVPVPGNMPQQYSAAAPAAGNAMPSQPRIVRAFPQLSSFKSLENLYEVVTYGNFMSGTLSFADRTKADPDWRRGLSKQLFDIDSAVKEMTERAEAESRQTGQKVSPRKHAKIMDVERAEHGESKDTGKPTPVASWVKTVLGPIRADKNKEQKGVHEAYCVLH